MTELSDKVMILREALQSLRADIMDMECHEETLIKLERARDEKGQFIADDPSTPDINEAYKQED